MRVIIVVLCVYMCVCVCVCVCVSLCVSVHTVYSGSTHNKKYNEIYHCVKPQICGNIKMEFFLKLSYSKFRTFFTYVYFGRGSHF